MLSLAGVHFAETKDFGRLCQSNVAWDVTWKGRQQKALVCLINRIKSSFYKGWFWACKQHGTESKDRLFFHELPNPRHSQPCPAEREYLQWCNPTDMAILVYTRCLKCQVMSTFSTAQICSQNELLSQHGTFHEELPSMSPLKFKHPENLELPLPVFAKLMCRFTAAGIWKSVMGS